MAEDSDGKLGHPAPPPTRPFTTIPDRPPLRAIPEIDMQKVAADVHSVAIKLRSQARRDAIMAVCRARERVGIPATLWSVLEVDSYHAIVELLLQIQTQDRSIMRQTLDDRDGA